MPEDRQDGYAEVAASLRRRAAELWGERRASDLRDTIEDAARSIRLVETNPPPPDVEPAQYLTSRT